MKVVTSIQKAAQCSPPIALTIGNFDGLHRGHLAVISRLKEIAKESKAKTGLLTFSNHPLTILSPPDSPPQICTIAHKSRLLKELAIDFLILLPFTRSLSEQTAADFLQNVKRAFPFDQLVLGSDATFGKNKEGDQQKIKKLQNQLHFQVEYLPDTTIDGEKVSSSKIRKYIEEGNLKKAEAFLGRPFSIYGEITRGTGRGSAIGFPTANLAVDGLCLPPLGVFAVTMKHKGKQTFGVANLGVAPTLRNDPKPVFEIHLLDHISNLYGETVEVIFNEFIREERRFSGIEELKLQIAKDIQMARNIHSMHIEPN